MEWKIGCKRDTLKREGVLFSAQREKSAAFFRFLAWEKPGIAGTLLGHRRILDSFNLLYTVGDLIHNPIEAE